MKYIVACMVAIFILSGCSIDGRSQTADNDSLLGDEAITKVILETNRVDFPTEAGRVKGTIRGGGPAPGLRIPGEFTSAATSEDKDTFIVLLTEYWSSDDFRNEDSPEKTILSHYWKYKVTKSEVEILEDGGDLSPEFVE